MAYLLPGESFADMQRRLARERPRETTAEERAAFYARRHRTTDAMPPPRRDTSNDVHVHIHGPGGSGSGQSDAGGFGVGSAVRSAGHGATGAARAATKAINTASRATQPHSGDAPRRRFLPGRDERRDPGDITCANGIGDEGEGEVIGELPADSEVVGELPAPPEGMTYTLEPGDSGGFVLVLVPEDEAEPDPDELSTADRAYRAPRFRDGDPVLRAMNRANRAHWGKRTRDAETRITFEQLADPSPGHYELVQSGSGCVYLVLVSPSRPEIAGNTPLGGNGDGPQIRSTTDRSRTNPTTARLRSMNAANKRFWG